MSRQVLLHQTFCTIYFGIFLPATPQAVRERAHLVTLYFYFEKRGPYPDFADGVPEAFVVSSLTECYGIKLSFVEVGHGAFPLLLTERFGGFQGVLKCPAVKREQVAASSLIWTFLPS